MSFLVKNKQKKKQKKKDNKKDNNNQSTISLQTRSKKIQTPILKRMSLTASGKGSLTIEASFIVPIFLFAMINLISFLDILRLYINVESALHQTSRELAVYGYLFQEGKNDDDNILNSLGSVAFSETYVKAKLIQYLGKEYLDNSCIDHGCSGITLLGSKIMEDDKIELVATYQIEPQIPYIGFRKFFLQNRCVVRAFTGYEKNKFSTSKQKEEIVFITETGTVYHRNRNCSHLNISVSIVPKNTVFLERNEEGGIYHACSRCGGIQSDTVYITNTGNKFHTMGNCSGLKRTISAIPISEIGNRRECYDCSD